MLTATRYTPRVDQALNAGPDMGRDGLDLALHRELRRGERLLWQGRPIARVRPSTFGIYLFAVPWTAFSLFWTAMATMAAPGMSEQGNGFGWASWVFPLFGAPFIAVGIGMLAAPFWPLYTARRSLFAVTDQRLIHLTLGRELKSQTLPAARIGHIKRSERADGSGMLQIAIRVGTDSEGDRHTDTFDIGEVADVMEVEREIGRLVERARRKRISP